MGWLQRLFEGLPPDRTEVKAGDRFGAVEQMWGEVFSGGTSFSSSGPAITWARALQVSTVLRCVSVLADGVATVPFKLYRKEGDKRTAARDNPLYDLMASSPNDWMTSLEFRETMMIHLALTGNFYAFKNKVRGEVVELLPLQPNKVKVEQKNDWSVVYTVTGTDGRQLDFSQDAIWHVRGRSMDGFKGMDAVKLARDALGLAIATEETQATLHQGGVRPGGILAVEKNLTEDQFLFYRKWIEANAGAMNAGRPLVMDAGVKWQQMALTSVDNQHLETRKFQVEDICAHFGLMPIMVGFSDKASTYASAEQMFLAHQVNCIRPLHRRIEQSADKHLLRSIDRRNGYYFGFVDTEMLRGAAKDRAEYYNKMVLAGIMTRNEVRALEELDALPGLEKGILPANYSVLDANGVPIVPELPKTNTAPAKDAQKPDDEPSAAKMMQAAVEGMSRAFADAKSPTITVECPAVTVHPPEITVNTPEVKVDVAPANFTAGDMKIDVHAVLPRKGAVEKTVTAYDDAGRIVSMRETEVEES